MTRVLGKSILVVRQVVDDIYIYILDEIKRIIIRKN